MITKSVPRKHARLACNGDGNEVGARVQMGAQGGPADARVAIDEKMAGCHRADGITPTAADLAGTKGQSLD